MIAKRGLFRTQALRHYTQNKQKDILPDFVSPPVFLILWLLLLIIGTALVAAWQIQVPTYTQVQGVILEQQAQPTTALLFVPADLSARLVIPREITLQVSLTGLQLQASVTTVDRGSITPTEAAARYALTGDARLAITGPSIVINLDLTPPQARQVGNLLNVSAQIQTGSRSLFSILPALLKNAFGV